MPVYTNAGQLRAGRFSESGRIYLLTAVVDQRQPFFVDWRLGRLVVQELRQAQEEGWADFLTWVVRIAVHAKPVAAGAACVRLRSSRKNLKLNKSPTDINALALILITHAK
jgi:hypothetical protein